MTTLKQTVKAEGEGHQIVTVGGNLVFADKYLQQKQEFFEPKLDQFKPPRFISPNNLVELSATCQTQRLLILGGSLELDKSGLARHLAWYISEQVKTSALTSGAQKDDIPILEWYRTTDAQNLLEGIQETESPTIFILPQIAPQDLGYNPGRIQQAARSRGHFIIASTDIPLAGWKLPDKQEPIFWKELLPDALYSPEQLAEMLLQTLIEFEDTLPEELKAKVLELGTNLVGQLGIREAARALRTPNNIAYFVELLCQQKKPLQEAALREQIALSQDPCRVVGQWFLTALNPNEQLLALGLAMLEGLFDEQFFAAFEKIMTEVWRKRDPWLVFPDYHDLDNLRNFYSFIESAQMGTKIEARLPEQRRALVEIAWKGHRRKMITALPVLASLVQNSVDGRSRDATLYGSYTQRSELRDAIGEALSDIGLIAPDAIETTMMQLAADQDSAVQSVAAQAMARWRAHGKDDELFIMLKRWQFDARLIALMRSFQDGKEETKTYSPEAQIRATVALTVGYAALYDAPNQLSEKLIELIRELVSDQNELVRDRFRWLVLPIIVPQHVVQLRQELYTMVRYIDLIPSIGAALARAYRSGPRDVVALLDDWSQKCDQNRPNRINKNIIEHRDALLAAVALTLGQIEYSDTAGAISAQTAFKRLQGILERERHPFIRTAVVLAITKQAEKHFKMVEPQLQRLVSEVTPNEREEIVKILGNVYLEQRAGLQGGNGSIEVKEKRYPIWMDSQKRPLTEVEQAMFHWLEADGNPVARQIATQAFVVFASLLDQEELKFIKQKQKTAEERAKAAQLDTSLSRPEQPIMRAIRQSTMTANLAAWLATINAVEHRQRIKDILPEALLQNRSQRLTMSFVLTRWANTQIQLVKATSKYLKRAISLADNAGCYLVLLLVMLMIAFSSCMCVISTFFQ